PPPVIVTRTKGKTSCLPYRDRMAGKFAKAGLFQRSCGTRSMAFVARTCATLHNCGDRSTKGTSMKHAALALAFSLLVFPALAQAPAPSAAAPSVQLAKPPAGAKVW